MPSRLESFFKAIVWPLVAVTLGVYLAMVLWSLPQLQTYSDGQLAFDLRPMGYGYEDAQSLISALGPDGINFYLGIQQFLDLFYPALMALTLFVSIALLLPKNFGIWRLILPWIAFPGAAFDYAENTAVREMLLGGPEGLDPTLVAWASQASQMKALFSSMAMLLLAVLLLRWGWRRLRGARES
ncbi:MAG: hypothetical protein KDJ19_05380 [Hyphomicrobiaceae bacterium]|nr:hypothetical protein [Hyphomicrobiaceae bacterium]MCC0024932.1 hypothetical protein [Hyphomicrobiaceae bacterium]